SGRASEKRRTEPAQLLMRDHRRPPPRPRPLRREGGVERAASDDDLVLRSQRDALRMPREHARRREEMLAVQPRVGDCRDAVEAEPHLFAVLPGEANAPPPIL